MTLPLGCIADDFTGATDLANTLTRQGMATAVLLGVPPAGLAVPEADAIVIALKSRSNPAIEAVRMSLAALDWLKRAGARQFYFKYCSTFDSTHEGNIGPVADALVADLGAPIAIVCPAFPTNKRTVYLGHLFVGPDLLSESSMRHHPLTPMTDSSLVRLLQQQARGRVGLVPYAAVSRGARAISDAVSTLEAQGCRYAVVDALTDDDLLEIGSACASMKLLTGGSGLALGLPRNFREQGLLQQAGAAPLSGIDGHAAVLAGSCSEATVRQVATMKHSAPALEIDALSARTPEETVAAALDWARPRLGQSPVLIYSTGTPEKIAEVQARLGRERAGALIERIMADIAKRLVDLGVRRLVVAGGETAGAVVNALGIEGLRIGPEIDPGVPWTASLSDPPLALALKSGNFGAEDFFMKAFEVLKSVDRESSEANAQ